MCYKDYFKITSVHRDDLEHRGFDTSNVDMMPRWRSWPIKCRTRIWTGVFGKILSSSPTFWEFPEKTAAIRDFSGAVINSEPETTNITESGRSIGTTGLLPNGIEDPFISDRLYSHFELPDEDSYHLWPKQHRDSTIGLRHRKDLPKVPPCSSAWGAMFFYGCLFLNHKQHDDSK
jgi:hypothetical protein